MGIYAAQTTVEVERSKSEIEDMVRRYRATEWTTGWKTGAAMVGFRLKDLTIRFVLPTPDRAEKRFWYKTVRKRQVKVSDSAAETRYQQDLRQRWRALMLVVKAKLEAVECGISTLEQEFLAFIVLPSDLTIGDWMLEHALPAIRAGQNPLALTGRKVETIQDAEIA